MNNMSIKSLPTSTISDTNSSDCEIYKAQDEESYNEKNIISNDNIFSQSILTESEKYIISLSDVKLKEMLTKLNVANVHITPLVDLILQVASSCSEVEFIEKIKTNESVCSITKQQYIRSFTAAQILRDVNLELLEYQKPNSALYSMNTKNSFIVNSAIDDLLNGTDLANLDTIYIDRDTMSQLLELHELVTETINKLKKAERVKKEASFKHSPNEANQIQSMDSTKTKESQENQFLPEKKTGEIDKVSAPQKSGCCLQSFEGKILNKCICSKPHITKIQEQNDINAKNENRNTSNRIPKQQNKKVKSVEIVPQKEDTSYQKNRNAAPEKPKSDDAAKLLKDSPKIESTNLTSPEIESPKPEIETAKPETESPKPEIERTKPEEESPKPEIERAKPEEESPKPEVERAKPEEESPKPEVERAKPEEESPKPEIERAKPEEESPKPEIERAKSKKESSKPKKDSPKPKKESPKKPKKDKRKPEKDTTKHSPNISTTEIAEPTFEEPIGNLPNALSTEMLPNDKQLTVIPSDTVLRNFASLAPHKVEKPFSRKNSQGILSTYTSSSDENKNLERSLTNVESNTTTRSYKKDKKSKKEALSDKKLKKTGKLSKKQKREDNNKNDEEEKSDVTTNNKKKSNQSLEDRSIENNNDNGNLDFKQKNKNLNSEKPDKLNKLNNKEKKKKYENTNQDLLPIKDEEFSKNAIKPEKEAPESVKTLDSVEKLEVKKSDNKLKGTDDNNLTFIEQPTDSITNKEYLLKPQKYSERHKDSNKNVKNDEKFMKSNKKNNTGEKEIMEHPKNINDKSTNASVQSINQPNATVMQAPSIHVHNNDFATNKQFFSKRSDTNKEKITQNSMILNTSIQKETENTVGSSRNTLMMQNERNNNNKNVPNVNDTSTAVRKRNNKPIPQVAATTDKVDVGATSKRISKMARNTQISNDIKIKSPREFENKVVIIEDTERRDRKEIEKSETSQSLLQRKTISREVFSNFAGELVSTILKEAAPKIQERQVNKKIASMRNNNYDNVADAKTALLQCLNELKKIRSYIKECDDAELRTLEQNINVKILEHDKNCGLDDAPHVHCNLQGIELTLKSDKKLNASNCYEDIASKKDADSSAQQLVLGTPINSNNSIILHANASKPNGRQTQTSANDTDYKSFSIEAQTDDPAFFSIPAETTSISELSENVDDFYDMFNPQYTSSNTELNADPKQDENNAIKNLSKSIEQKGSSAGIPYIVGIKSLPKMEDTVYTTESMIISVDSMKKIMVNEEIFHTNDSVNRALNSININNLLLSCTPVVCSRKTSLNDRRDIPELPMKPSLTSLPLSATDLVVIRQNIERKSNNAMNDKLPQMRTTNCNYNIFEYYTNFQANFASNKEYFVPSVHLVYYFEIQRDDDSGDSDKIGKLTPRNLTPHSKSTQQEDEAYSETENKWSDFKLFDYIRKEFSTLRGDGLAPKTSSSLNVKTMKGNRNKKIQVSLTKTIEIPIKPKRRSSRIYETHETTNQATQSCAEAAATQTIPYCKLLDKQISQRTIQQKFRTLHTQTANQPPATNSLANILLDTIYETEFENPIQKSVKQIYNLSHIVNTPTSMLQQLKSSPESIRKELIVETNQYEINNSLKPNSSTRSSTNLFATSSKLKSNYKCNYQSFIPRPKTSIMNATIKDSNILRTSASMTRVSKPSTNQYMLEKKQTPHNSTTSILPRTPTREKIPSLTESSSDCEDAHAGLPIQSAQTSASNVSQSRLISCSPKQHSAHNRHNIVRDKIKNLPVYSSQSLGATLRRQKSFASSSSQVVFGKRSDNNTSVASSIFNLPKKHSCGFLSVLSPTCGCPDVTVFIPCYCYDKNTSTTYKSGRNTDSLDILNKGVSGIYHVIMPPVHNSNKLRN